MDTGVAGAEEDSLGGVGRLLQDLRKFGELCAGLVVVHTALQVELLAHRDHHGTALQLRHKNIDTETPETRERSVPRASARFAWYGDRRCAEE